MRGGSNMIGSVGARGARVFRKEKGRGKGKRKIRKGEVRMMMTMMDLGLGRFWVG